MAVGEFRFRTSPFGFHRQDVINYIEAIHRDYAAQIQSLKKDLERERGQRSQMEEQGSLASTEAAAATKDAQRSKEDLQAAQKALEEAQRQREDLRLRLQAAQEDLAALQEAADRMAPAARAYETLKDKTAEIELDAHNRAQRIIQEGEAQAAEIQEKAAQWLRQVESSYARLRSDVSATFTHTVKELERTARSLDGVTAELDSHGQRLRSIADLTGGKEKQDSAKEEKPVEVKTL